MLLWFSGEWAADSESGPGQEPRGRDEPRDEEGLHRHHPGRPDREDLRLQGHEGHHQDGRGLGQNQGQTHTQKISVY